MTHRQRRWRTHRATAGLASVVLVAGLATSGPAAAADSAVPGAAVPGEAAVEPRLAAELAAGGTASFWVYLREQAALGAAAGIADRAAQGEFVHRRLTATAARSQAGLVALLDREGADYQQYWIANTVQVTGDTELLARIAALPEVAQVAADRSYPLIEPEPAAAEPGTDGVEWNVNRVGAPRVWDELGVTGEDIVVATIDTGVQFDHPALVAQYRGNQGDGSFDHHYHWYDPSNVCGNPSLVPCDNNGHGTHVTGTMVGDDGSGNRIGVAPGAQWIAAKGCESRSCSQQALLRSGQFILAPTDLAGENPDPERRPHIVNNSWGGATIEPWYESTVEAWVAAGIFPQFASGNPGPGCGLASHPGNLAASYSAGAFDIDDQIYVNSGRGPSVWDDALIKPNLAAPGVAVRSAAPGDAYQALTGTSMASPHVAGVVALIWSATAGLERQIDATRAVLDLTAQDTDDQACGGTAANNNVWGQGKLDAFAAVGQSPRRPTGTLVVTVTDADTEQPLAGVSIGITGEVRRQRVTGPDGSYTIALPVGDYQLSASTFGYESWTGAATIVEDQSTRVTIPLAKPAGRSLRVSTDSLDFGEVTVGGTAGPLAVTLTSVAAKPVQVRRISAPAAGFAATGGTCGATPFRLSHLESCTVEYGFAPTLVGPAESTVRIVSNAADFRHPVTLHGTAVPLSARVDAVTLADGENGLDSAVIGPAGEFAYVGTQGAPGQVVKIDLATFQRVDALTLATGENNAISAAIDPAGAYLYIGTQGAPGRVVKIDLATFERVDAIALGPGENTLRSVVLDPAGEYAYFGTGTRPGRVVKIDLATFERVDALILGPGENTLRSVVLDPAGEFAYFGTGTNPGRVVKVDLASFERVEAVGFEAGEFQLFSGVMDPAGEFAYFAAAAAPGRVVKVDLDPFARVGALELAAGEDLPRTAVIDPAGDFAYFATFTAPSRVVQVDLRAFQRVAAVPLAPGENRVDAAAMDPAGGFAYFATSTVPGRVVKVDANIEIELRAEPRREGGAQVVDLFWLGATTAEVSIFRDGALIATTPNTGFHSDPIGQRGTGSYTYRVCQPGACSDEVTATFGGARSGLDRIAE